MKLSRRVATRCVGVECCWCRGLAPEPVTATEDPIVAAANRLTVTTFIRWGVSQVVCRACSQERAPVAPAIAAIAHTAHM